MASRNNEALALQDTRERFADECECLRKKCPVFKYLYPSANRFLGLESTRRRLNVVARHLQEQVTHLLCNFYDATRYPSAPFATYMLNEIRPPARLTNMWILLINAQF